MFVTNDSRTTLLQKHETFIATFTHLRLRQVGRVMEVRQHHLKGIIKHFISKMSVVNQRERQVLLKKAAHGVTWNITNMERI